MSRGLEPRPAHGDAEDGFFAGVRISNGALVFYPSLCAVLRLCVGIECSIETKHSRVVFGLGLEVS